MNKNLIGKQSQGVERIYKSIHETICQSLEIVQLEMGEEFSPFSDDIADFVEYQAEPNWSMKRSYLKEIRNNSDEELHHFGVHDQLIKKIIQRDGNLSFFVGMISCLKAAVAVESQEILQEFRPRLNQRGPIYTKGKVVDLWYFDSRKNFNMSNVVIYTLLAHR
jgi:hypothetical protein